MSGVAGNARRGFVVRVGNAIERVSLARGVGVPAIAGQELKIHRRLDRPPRGRGDALDRRDRPRRASGTAARQTAWCGVDTRADKRRPRVVGSPGEHAGRELVGAGPRRPLALQALGVDPLGVFHDLTFLLPINPQVGRNVAVDEVEPEKAELGNVRLKGEREPIAPAVRSLSVVSCATASKADRRPGRRASDPASDGWPTQACRSARLRRRLLIRSSSPPDRRPGSRLPVVCPRRAPSSAASLL